MSRLVIKLPTIEGRRTLRSLGSENLQPKAKDNTLKWSGPFCIVCFDNMKARFQNLNRNMHTAIRNWNAVYGNRHFLTCFLSTVKWLNTKVHRTFMQFKNLNLSPFYFICLFSFLDELLILFGHSLWQCIMFDMKSAWTDLWLCPNHNATVCVCVCVCVFIFGYLHAKC